MREYIHPNRPVVIGNVGQQWPALSKWSMDYLRKIINTETVQIAVVPKSTNGDGLADAIVDGKFQLPEERKMSFSEFIDIITGAVTPEDEGIYYLQRQNSCLTEGKDSTNITYWIFFP